MMNGWLPMSLAPRDGTEILVCEWIGTDQPFVCVAAWIRRENTLLEARWWGSVATYVNGGEFPAKFKDIAITPACWRPLPPPEDKRTIRRRYAQLLRATPAAIAASQRQEGSRESD